MSGVQGYRADIQGLRAIAVGAVVVFHAFPELLTGGFVGVDIFFVISGFLISGILHRDILAKRFSLADFYRKRVRRIFPALFVMLLVTLSVGYLFLSPAAYSELARNALTSTFFVSNVDFYRSSGYFGSMAELRPLLHTWSLSVEEQFYIVFPLTILIVLRFLPRLLLPLVWISLVASLAISQWALVKTPLGAYFLSPFRVFEFLVGVVVALGPIPKMLKTSEHWRSFFSLSGLGMIATALFLYTPETPFPGVAALLPTGGAGLVLMAGRGGESFGSRLISHRPFLYIGAISYSLYLWHWPVMAYLRVGSQPEHPDAWMMGLALGVSIALAALSYKFVEQPIMKHGFRLPYLRLGAAVMGITALAAGVVIGVRGFPHRFSPEALRVFHFSEDSSPERNRCHRGEAATIPYQKTCVLGATGVEPNLAIWGDSHGAELALALSELLAAEGRSVRQITASACPPVIGVKIPDRPNCDDVNIGLLDGLISDPSINEVVLAANSDRYVDTFQGVQDGYAEVVDTLRLAGKRVLLLGQLPNIGMDAPLIAGYAVQNGADPHQIGLRLEGEVQHATDWRAFQIALADKTGAIFLDPVPALCTTDLCPLSNERGDVLYYNPTHISMAGAREVAAALRPSLNSSYEAGSSAAVAESK